MTIQAFIMLQLGKRLSKMENTKNRPNLLIVDDELNVTRSLDRSLRDQFNVFVANSAIAALDIIKVNEIAVVLTDQRMPGTTGVELLKEIYKVKPHVSGILLSGYSDANALIDALNLSSVRGFISKPWDINALREKLLEAVTIFEHLINENTAKTDGKEGVKLQNLKELKKMLENIANLDDDVLVTSELRQLVKNPFSNRMSDYEYLNQLQDGFAIIQPDGRLLYSNPAFKKYFSFNEENQKNILTFFDLNDTPQLHNIIQSGLNGKNQTIDLKIKPKADISLYVEVSVTPVMDDEGKYHAVVVIHDQTEKEKTISYLKGINEVVLNLNKSKNFEDGLEVILHLCQKIFDIDGAAAFFYNEEMKTFELSCGTGLTQEAKEYLQKENGSLEISKIDLENENGWAIAINEANKNSLPIFPDLLLHQPIFSIAYAAIREKSKVVGLIAIFNSSPRMFNEELLLLSAISNEIGIARFNTRLQEELLNQARLDSVTSLINRRYFLESADQYYVRGKFNRAPLTVFMIDVDNFKQINDRFGHSAGDEALKAIASLIKGSIRPSDLIGRYGGDEFSVIITDCDQKLAENIMKRFEEKFKSYSFSLYHEQIQLSVSIGYAVANFDKNETIETLLNRSDMQMYKIKNKKKLNQ